MTPKNALFTLDQLRNYAKTLKIPNASNLDWEELNRLIDEQNARANWAVHGYTDYK